jgi:3-deoxy-D-manno-octulosonic-acid transferase
MGEMGLWYRLAPLAFIGHSLPVPGRPLTGKNPFEAAALGVAVLHGPCTTNFAESYDALTTTAAARFVEDGQMLGRAVAEFSSSTQNAVALGTRGQEVLDRMKHALPVTTCAVVDRLPPPAAQSRLESAAGGE